MPIQENFHYWLQEQASVNFEEYDAWVNSGIEGLPFAVYLHGIIDNGDFFHFSDARFLTPEQIAAKLAPFYKWQRAKLSEVFFEAASLKQSAAGLAMPGLVAAMQAAGLPIEIGTIKKGAGVAAPTPKKLNKINFQIIA